MLFENCIIENNARDIRSSKNKQKAKLPLNAITPPLKAETTVRYRILSKPSIFLFELRAHSTLLLTHKLIRHIKTFSDINPNISVKVDINGLSQTIMLDQNIKGLGAATLKLERLFMYIYCFWQVFCQPESKLSPSKTPQE
ncbi:hypothetical protein [Pseudoalteromonas sp. T1lg10]|uniref:hypothetical protein n=1 Tax=Pseudoalteromonas sp. T1lg10 TaxID=2077093 RepID=UPI000CF6277A|nr:hypothetical protein [Pseudoalteromonas sp. T1lg10]